MEASKLGEKAIDDTLRNWAEDMRMNMCGHDRPFTIAPAHVGETTEHVRESAKRLEDARTAVQAAQQAENGHAV